MSHFHSRLSARSYHQLYYSTNRFCLLVRDDSAGTHAYNAGVTGGKDTRAAGIPWVYAPILDIVSNQASSRTYETFGEDPYLSGTFGAAMIYGYQGNTSAGSLKSPTKVAACAKHFLAYQAEKNGQDHGPSVVGTSDLYVALQQFKHHRVAASDANQDFVPLLCKI